MSQRMARCPMEVSARITLSDTQEKLHSVTVFQNVIQEITEDESIDPTKNRKEVTTNLLESTSFICTFTGGTIINVERPLPLKDQES